jgi:hypothetical protein
LHVHPERYYSSLQLRKVTPKGKLRGATIDGAEDNNDFGAQAFRLNIAVYSVYFVEVPVKYPNEKI